MKVTSTWQLQDAKARLSEVVRQAIESGPQAITVRGEEAVVIISRKQYEKALGKKPSFVEFIKASPIHGVELDIERNKSKGRNIKL